MCVKFMQIRNFSSKYFFSTLCANVFILVDKINSDRLNKIGKSANIIFRLYKNIKLMRDSGLIVR